MEGTSLTKHKGSPKDKTLAQFNGNKSFLENQISTSKCKKKQKHYSNVVTDEKEVEDVELHKKHCAKEEKREVFQCLFCDMISTEIATILQHKAMEHPAASFYCNRCQFAALKWKKMKKHFLRSHPESKSKTLNDVSARKLVIGGKQRTFKCKCGLMAFREETFIRHKKNIHPLEKFNCDMCTFSSHTWKELCEHVSSIHPKTKSFSLNTAASLSESKVKVTSDDSGGSISQGHVSKSRKRKLVVDVTNEPIEKLKVLGGSSEESTINIITNNERLDCKPPGTMSTNNVTRNESLDAEFTGINENESDRRPSGGKGERSFFCLECDRIFYDEMDLNCHKFTHDKNRPILCEMCDRSFCNKWSLKVHLRKHENDKPYECYICEYSTTQHIILEQHLLTHCDSKSFQCKECGYTARVKGQLVVHTRKHTQERPFGCRQCGRRFNQRAHLKNHQYRKHEQEKYQLKKIKLNGDSSLH